MKGLRPKYSVSDPPTANATLRVQGTPPVQSVVFSAAQQVERGGAGSGAGRWARLLLGLRRGQPETIPLASDPLAWPRQPQHLRQLDPVFQP